MSTLTLPYSNYKQKNNLSYFISTKSVPGKYNFVFVDK